MGVMACDRFDCKHIMCDRLILDGTEYICNDCYQELLESKESWENVNTPYDLKIKIEYFMRTATGSQRKPCSKEELEAEFKRLMGDKSEYE